MSRLGAGNLIATLVVVLKAAARLRASDGDTEDESRRVASCIVGAAMHAAHRASPSDPGYLVNSVSVLPYLRPLYASWPLQGQLIRKPPAFKHRFHGNIVSGGWKGRAHHSLGSAQARIHARAMQPGAIPRRWKRACGFPRRGRITEDNLAATPNCEADREPCHPPPHAVPSAASS